jgi:predicted RNase H-like nuclease (RuvC/YqgF family)
MKDACEATSNEYEIENLQQENDRLQQEIQMLKQGHAELEAKLKFFEEQLRLLRHRQFGASSEQIPEQSTCSTRLNLRPSPMQRNPPMKKWSFANARSPM